MNRVLDHLKLATAAVIMGGPLLMVLLGALRPGGLSGGQGSGGGALAGLQDNLSSLARLVGEDRGGPGVDDMILTSLILGAGVAVLSTVVAFLAAYSMTFLERSWTRACFWLTLLTFYFPIEARMLKTFEVTAELGMLNTMPGLVLPVLPLAMATFIFRQHMRAMPPAYLEAARLDGAGPLVFLRDFVLPLSMGSIGAVLLITFIIGWNQYLWPLMVSLDNSLFPLMRGLNLAGAGSGPSMVLAAVSVLPPLLLVVAFLRLLSAVTSIQK